MLDLTVLLNFSKKVIMSQSWTIFQIHAKVQVDIFSIIYIYPNGSFQESVTRIEKLTGKSVPLHEADLTEKESLRRVRNLCPSIFKYLECLRCSKNIHQAPTRLTV